LLCPGLVTICPMYKLSVKHDGCVCNYVVNTPIKRVVAPIAFE